MSNELWFGIGPMGKVIYDPSVQNWPGEVALFHIDQNDVKKYLADEVRPLLTEIKDDRQFEAVRKKYAEFLKFYSSRLRKLNDQPPFSYKKYHEIVRTKHRQRFEKFGLEYKGATMSKKIIPRTANCWACGDSLSTSTGLICNVCNWIVCDCGACGCKFR